MECMRRKEKCEFGGERGVRRDREVRRDEEGMRRDDEGKSSMYGG